MQKVKTAILQKYDIGGHSRERSTGFTLCSATVLRAPKSCEPAKRRVQHDITQIHFSAPLLLLLVFSFFICLLVTPVASPGLRRPHTSDSLSTKKPVAQVATKSIKSSAKCTPHRIRCKVWPASVSIPPRREFPHDASSPGCRSLSHYPGAPNDNRRRAYGNLEITVSRALLLRDSAAAQSVVERKTTIRSCRTSS